jgi:hypothetical protein
MMRPDLQPAQRSTGLVEVLDRVLDKGLVVAGDIKVSLAEVELLTIRVRLLVCSIDKAQEIGLDWWRHDRHFSAGGKAGQLEAENEDLRVQVRKLERKILEMSGKRAPRPARALGVATGGRKR